MCNDIKNAEGAVFFHLSLDHSGLDLGTVKQSMIGMMDQLDTDPKDGKITVSEGAGLLSDFGKIDQMDKKDGFITVNDLYKFFGCTKLWQWN